MFVEEHPHALNRIGQSDLLRRGDDERTCQSKSLHQRQVNIARSWREVNEQIIQLAPVRLGKELLEGITCHTATP